MEMTTPYRFYCNEDGDLVITHNGGARIIQDGTYSAICRASDEIKKEKQNAAQEG